VDDLLMEITHVFRGADHLSNTANQAALFHALNKPLPIYWHLPILVNLEGKKLSKRDFGFSLRDLKDAGFLPEAVGNYVSIIGGSFKEEIMPLETLATVFNFNNIHASSHITYDVEKLKWVNKSWINRYDPHQLTLQCRPFLEQAYGEKAKNCDDVTLTQLLQTIKSEMITTRDAVSALEFYFTEPEVIYADIEACIPPVLYNSLKEIITTHKNLLISNQVEFTPQIKLAAKNANIPLKELFWFLRLAMTGKINGPGIHELIAMLGGQQALKRIEKTLDLLS
jgi:glutamyl/glutaminyl-tRNA synthetase